MSRILTALVAFALATPALAADSLGRAGTVELLDVNHSTAGTYLQYHGRVFVNDLSGSVEYRWGGTSCSNKALPDSQVALLARALETGLIVTPRYVAGQGANRCLVGFIVQVP